MTYVLLSIDPQWATAILAGRKRFEYRRVLPSLTPPFTNFLYATDPIQAVVGHVHTPRTVTGTVDEVIDQTIDETPHEVADIEEYFEGKDEAGAMECAHPSTYETPIPRDVLVEAGIAPSQNFRYVDEIPTNAAGYFPSEVVPA